jgi:hypothetical protein
MNGLDEMNFLQLNCYLILDEMNLNSDISHLTIS